MFVEFLRDVEDTEETDVSNNKISVNISHVSHVGYDPYHEQVVLAMSNGKHLVHLCKETYNYESVIKKLSTATLVKRMK